MIIWYKCINSAKTYILKGGGVMNPLLVEVLANVAIIVANHFLESEN